MSTKIDSSAGPSASLPLQMDKLASAKLAKSADGGQTGAASGGSSRGSDTVKITGDAMQMHSLAKSVSGGSSFDAKRVEAVKQAIAGGTYKVNPERIASRMTDSDASLG